MPWCLAIDWVHGRGQPGDGYMESEMTRTVTAVKGLLVLRRKMTGRQQGRGGH